MQRLSERRDMLCLKFAKKSLKVENFKHLFPINSKKHTMKTRGNDLYTVNSGFSARYKRSAIPAMQKILNRDRKEQLSAQKKLLNSPLSPTNFAFY